MTHEVTVATIGDDSVTTLAFSPEAFPAGVTWVSHWGAVYCRMESNFVSNMLLNRIRGQIVLERGGCESHLVTHHGQSWKQGDDPYCSLQNLQCWFTCSPVGTFLAGCPLVLQQPSNHHHHAGLESFEFPKGTDRISCSALAQRENELLGCGLQYHRIGRRPSCRRTGT